MTEKHTPGPWEIDGEYVQQADQTDIAICDVMNMDKGGDTGWYRGPITQANARLIAAAPELLEAAKAALNCFCEMPVTQARAELLHLLGDAIEKALGEEL